ncbi:MAG: hypothetical protein QM405_03950 [Euryarchaeota archaeon]|nr:hypothetical protein [Euryarchaeota archaeon]
MHEIGPGFKGTPGFNFKKFSTYLGQPPSFRVWPHQIVVEFPGGAISKLAFFITDKSNPNPTY